MTPAAIKTLCTSLNGGATIDDTLLTSLLNIAKAIFEGERDWMMLRKTNTSLSVSASNTSQWNTAISLAGITDFSRFYGEYPIRIFDGSNCIEYYRQVPFSKRLEYKDANNTFCHDPINKRIYLNGNVVLSGTLYINYIHTATEISDITSVVDMETSGEFPFPVRFHPILGFYAVGLNKGAIDYDSINREMIPANQNALVGIKNSMEKWDTQLQIDEVSMTDPTGNDMGIYRSGSINIQLQ